MAGGDRTSADHAIALAIASGNTRRRAAEVAGVSERSVYRRLQQPEFLVTIEETQAAIQNRATEGLSALRERAVAALGDLLNDKNPHIRLRAALGILDRLDDACSEDTSKAADREVEPYRLTRPTGYSNDLIRKVQVLDPREQAMMMARVEELLRKWEKLPHFQTGGDELASGDRP